MLLIDYLRKERKARKLQEEIESLKADVAVQQDIQFREELTALMQQYGMETEHVRLVLDPPLDEEPEPEAAPAPAKPAKSSKPSSAKAKSAKSAKPAAKPEPVNRRRAQRVYRNPHTGEELRTRGSNNAKLKEWKQEYGPDIVAEWRVQ